MSRRTRIFLAVLGLLLLLISITALSYALAPTQVLHDSAPISPTLFTLPPGGAP